MKWLISTLVIAVAITVRAGSEVSPIYAIAVNTAKPVSVALIRQADYVSIPVSIVSEQKEPTQPKLSYC